MEDIDLKELFMIFWNKKIQIILFIILFAIITVTRMPIDVVTMPIVLTLYAISTYVCTTKFDKELEKKKQEEAEKVAKA